MLIGVARENAMAEPSFVIRTMSRDELDQAVEWAAAEGWNPGLSDAEAFYAADPDGFLIGLADGEPVAVISAVRYGATFGFVGFFIVQPDKRGHSYGPALGRAALARLLGRCVGLDGVLAKQDNYRHLGFRYAHRNIRFQGKAGGMAMTQPPRLTLTPLATVPFAQLAEYDRAFFPADRTVFLSRWIAMPHCAALGLTDPSGRLVGYGVLRPCRVGCKIGPLFADSAQAAEALFTALTATAAGDTPIFLDVPECNAAAIALARRHGMSMVFETARMYMGDVPDIALGRTYGITTFELG